MLIFNACLYVVNLKCLLPWLLNAWCQSLGYISYTSVAYTFARVGHTIPSITFTIHCRSCRMRVRVPYGGWEGAVVKGVEIGRIGHGLIAQEGQCYCNFSFPPAWPIFILLTSRLDPLGVGLEVCAYQGQLEIKMLANLSSQFLSWSK